MLQSEVVSRLDPALANWFLGLDQNIANGFIAELLGGISTEAPPDTWQSWLSTLFPNLFYHPFVERHEQFWQHVESIEAGIKPPAFFAIWGRGGSKTTNAEAAAVRLGAKETRRFGLYTRSTQDKANESVANIAAMLESKQVAKYYPKLSERLVGKYGNSKGWKVSTLRCANGFNVVALGYDAAVRGIKIEEYRPDIIFVDDIDEKNDTLETTQKKINTLIYDILPSGSSDVAVVGTQNLINPNGVFTQIANGKADFLRDRIVSGPYPAIDDLEWEFNQETKRYHILSGTATWPGQPLATCEAQMNEWGIDAFLEEAQHLVTNRKGRVFHQFKGVGPDASELDYSKVSGYYRGHDFGAVNEVWGLYAKIGSKYYMIAEYLLPEGTTSSRAGMVKTACDGKDVVAGYGGAKGEKQIRLDYRKEGIDIRLPVVTDVERQVNVVNHMFEREELVICANCVHTIDQLQNAIRDASGKIANESTLHYVAQLRYLCAGVGGGLHWAM